MNAGELSGVPATMLWTLHNRANEALHRQGVLRDPKCVEIYHSIPFDYADSFGSPEPSHGVRSALFDDAVRRFIAAHHDAVVVNLGEGLETQRYRVGDDDGVLWVSIDVPEAMALRERFIEPDTRHIHVTKSALDLSWFDEIPIGRPVFVTAQGLLMYFSESEVRGLFRAMVQRWPGVEVMFDHIPRWLSEKSTSAKGWQLTPHYRVPPMPWGINYSEVAPTLRSWVGAIEDLSTMTISFPRGLRRTVVSLLTAIPWLKERAPGMTRVRFPRLVH